MRRSGCWTCKASSACWTWDGKITAKIAARLAQGAVVGVDLSVKMISYAQSHWGTNHGSNFRARH